MEAAWLDAEGATQTVVCHVSADCCLRMSPSAYWLFANLREGRTHEEIATLAERTFGSAPLLADVARACDAILAKVDEQTRIVEARKRRRYVFRIRLLPESVVGRLARRFHGVFGLCGILTYVALITTAGIAQAVSDGPRQLARFQPADDLAVVLLAYLLALVAHEFGHAAACSRYGARPGGIGFALYLAFPSLYCDVTRAWLLSRWQRVVVDVSGVIFESAAAAVLAILGGAFQQPAFTFASFLVLSNLVWALNPFGRFDMYWALTDAIGVVDLRAEGLRVVRGLLRKDRDGSIEQTWRRVLVVGYAICTMGIIGVFFYYSLRVGAPLVAHMPQIIHQVRYDVLQGRFGTALGTVMEPATMLLLLGVLLYRTGTAGIRLTLRQWLRFRARVQIGGTGPEGTPPAV